MNNDMGLPHQREKILQAAQNVFTEKGYSGATIAEIAAQAGLNPAIIYRFFTGKRELFNSLQRPDLDFPDQHEKYYRSLILRTALKIFSQKGYAVATMDDIAEAVGLSKAGIYFYFPSKENLFSSVLENPAAFVFINSSLDSFLSDKDSDLELGLINLAKTFLSLFTKEDFVSLLKIILSEGIRNPVIAEDFKEKIVIAGSMNVAGYLMKFFDLEMDMLILKTRIFFGMLISWGILNCLFQNKDTIQKFDLDRIAREYVHQFLFGVQGSIKKKE